LPTFAEILQDLPPGVYFDVPDVIRCTSKQTLVNTPDLQLYCNNEKCNGVRLFEYNQFPMMHETSTVEGGNSTSYEHIYLEYLCQNCKENIKSFAIMFIKIHEDNKTADFVKIGEFPFYGPHIPPKLISLIRTDRELFLKGLKCETQKLGIASFTYYRRVIENQKDRLIDNISKVLTTMKIDREALILLEEAKNEKQFKRSMEKLKKYFPNELLIQNTNPLVLLHNSLSIGIHGLTDAECLEYAHSVRIVLTELADKLKSILKNHNELRKAIAKLNKVKK